MDKQLLGYINEQSVEDIKKYTFAHVEVSNIRTNKHVPIFLSPTIPEGMVLVSQNVNYFDAQKIADEYWLDYNKFCAAHSAMLAAAQGERK